MHRQRSQGLAEEGHNEDKSPISNGKKPTQAGPAGARPDVLDDFFRHSIKNDFAFDNPQTQPDQKCGHDDFDRLPEGKVHSFET